MKPIGDHDQRLSKSLCEAIRLSVIENRPNEFLLLVKGLSEEKRVLYKEVYKKAIDERQQLIRDGIIREET